MATEISWEDEETGQLLTVRFDVTTSRNSEDVSTLTDHSVERGSDVSDSAREEPELLTIEGVVTNIPHAGNPGFADVAQLGQTDITVPTIGANETYTRKLDVPDPPVQPSPSGLIQAGVGAIGDALFGGPSRNATMNRAGPRGSRAASATTVSYSGAVDRVRDAYERLLTLKARRARVIATTSVRDYFDMVVVRVAESESAEEGAIGRFSVDLRRVRTVEAQTVAAPRPAEARGVAGKAAGSQATKKDPNADGKKRTRSVIKSLYADD